MPQRQPDADVLKTLRDAKELLARGETSRALELYEESWAGHVAAARHTSASHIAHMAGVADPDPERKLLWNERAIAAADAEPDRDAVAWSYASLFHNLAYALVLLGRRGEALRAERTAWSHVGAIEPGPYADQTRSVIQARLAELVAEAR